jgi:DNA (cytosine-5)-methyltransferase 1
MGAIGNPSVLDLFAGPGGLGEGFSQAGFFITAAVDNDEYACKTLTQNAGKRGTLVIKNDLRKLNLSGRVDVVVGGPPCQGFSMVGRSKIKQLRMKEGKTRVIDRRNSLYKHFVRAVSSLNPQFFVMENVPGIFSYRKGKIAKEIVRSFKTIGYDTDVRVLNAAEFGVPQIRKRAFFVGNRLGIVNPFPSRTHADIARSSQLRLDELGNLHGYVKLIDAISDLPALEPGQGRDDVPYPEPALLSEYQKWAREGSPKLYNHVARFQSGRDRAIFRLLEQGQDMLDLPKELRPYRDDIFADKIKKQSWNKPSSAILAHMQKDGLMYVHPDSNQARTFTPREAARLQSFPDRFRFYGPMTQQFRQIGNAVPPLLARSIAMAIKPFLIPADRPLVQYDVLTV